MYYTTSFFVSDFHISLSPSPSHQHDARSAEWCLRVEECELRPSKVWMEGGGAKTDNEIRGSKLSVWQRGEGGTRERRRRRTWVLQHAMSLVLGHVRFNMCISRYWLINGDSCLPILFGTFSAFSVPSLMSLTL